MDVVELAPCMSPACGFDDPAAFVEMMKSSIGIGLQNTGEGGSDAAWDVLPCTKAG
jgi:hypothetical protein